DWSNAYEQLSKVKAKIAYSREDRNNREKIYATIEAIDLPSVVNLYDRYKALEPQLVSEARSGRLKEWLIPAILTVVGIIGGVLGTKFFGRPNMRTSLFGGSPLDRAAGSRSRGNDRPHPSGTNISRFPTWFAGETSPSSSICSTSLAALL